MNPVNTRGLAALALLCALVAPPVTASMATPAWRTGRAPVADSGLPGWMAALQWIEQKVAAPEPSGIEAFGSVIAVQGDTAFVAAPKHPQNVPSGGQGDESALAGRHDVHATFWPVAHGVTRRGADP